MALKDLVSVEEDGARFVIALDEMFGKVRITGIEMFVGEDYNGDLAVLWDDSTLQNSGGGDMGSLLMRGDDDEVGKVMGEFYWERGFNERLQEILTVSYTHLTLPTNREV